MPESIRSREPIETIRPSPAGGLFGPRMGLPMTYTTPPAPAPLLRGAPTLPPEPNAQVFDDGDNISRQSTLVDGQHDDGYPSFQRDSFAHRSRRSLSGPLDNPRPAPPVFAPANYADLSPSPRIGRLRFISNEEDGAGSGYITNRPIGTLFETTQDVNMALQVRFGATTTTGPHGLELVNSGREWTHLGLKWFGGVPNFQNPQQNNCTLTAMSSMSGDVTMSCTYSGPYQSAVWNLLADGTLTTTWTATDGLSYNLDAATFLSGKGLVFVPSYPRFVAAGRSGYARGRLYLEPLQQTPALQSA